MTNGKYTIEFVLTQPRSKRGFDAFYRHIGFYNLAVPLLAALTPEQFKVRVVDQSNQPVDFESKSDIIALSFMTSHAVDAYHIADNFRKRGRTVVVGGIHVTALPEEAKQHADAVAIGEGETTWIQILKDFTEGNLRSFYVAGKTTVLDNLPIPLHDLMPRLSRRLGLKSIQTTRGCPYDCSFCSITNIYGRSFRKRPILDVVQEIKSLNGHSIIMADDNIMADPVYAARLFKALIPLGIKWLSQSDISIAKNEDLLELAAQSGCVGLLIGLESIHQEDLDAIGKMRYKADQYIPLMNNIHKHGIMISGSFIFGLDSQGPGIFEETVNFAKRVGLCSAFMPILTPYPGTRIYKQFEAEGRIFHKNWEEYDASHVVFSPRNMSPEELISGWMWATKEFASLSSILGRLRIAPVQLLYNLPLNMVNYYYSRLDDIRKKKP